MNIVVSLLMKTGSFSSDTERAAKDLRKLKMQGPAGDVDGYQMLLMAALHTERHAMQVDEIKNDPAYRK